MECYSILQCNHLWFLAVCDWMLNLRCNTTQLMVDCSVPPAERYTCIIYCTILMHTLKLISMRKTALWFPFPAAFNICTLSTSSFSSRMLFPMENPQRILCMWWWKCMIRTHFYIPTGLLWRLLVLDPPFSFCTDQIKFIVLNSPVHLHFDSQFGLLQQIYTIYLVLILLEISVSELQEQVLLSSKADTAASLQALLGSIWFDKRVQLGI